MNKKHVTKITSITNFLLILKHLELISTYGEVEQLMYCGWKYWGL